MKKVFLSLAVIATLTVVSCKEKEAAPAEEVNVETEVVAPEATTVDSTTVTVDSTTTTTTAPVQ